MKYIYQYIIYTSRWGVINCYAEILQRTGVIGRHKEAYCECQYGNSACEEMNTFHRSLVVLGCVVLCRRQMKILYGALAYLQIGENEMFLVLASIQKQVKNWLILVGVDQSCITLQNLIYYFPHLPYPQFQFLNVRINLLGKSPSTLLIFFGHMVFMAIATSFQPSKLMKKT